MTTEEFHGHLMAALHGPNAEAIAIRVMELMSEALRSDSKSLAGQAAVNFLVASGMVDMFRKIVDLQFLAHLEGVNLRDPRKNMAVIETKLSVLDDIRQSLREGLHATDQQEAFAEYFLDPKEPSE